MAKKYVDVSERGNETESSFETVATPSVCPGETPVSQAVDEDTTTSEPVSAPAVSREQTEVTPPTAADEDAQPEKFICPASAPSKETAPAAESEWAGVAFHVSRISQELFHKRGSQPRVLVMVHGLGARKIYSVLAGAGLATVAPQAGDWRLDINPKLASDTVTFGTKPKKSLFRSAYEVLDAAKRGDVQAIFLAADSQALACDNRFLLRAQQQGLRVFSCLEIDATREQWVECEPQASGPVPTFWRTCHHCKETFDNEDFLENHWCCPNCQTLTRMGTQERIDLILDDGVYEEWDSDLEDSDPLDFPGYSETMANQRSKTGLKEAITTGVGYIGRVRSAFGVMDSNFFMGSMGTMVGERVARLFDRATEEGLPVVLFCTSGGARMQEGLASLMQMAKTSCAIERHSSAGLLYVAVLTDPTTGGVTASFATLGDIILAEPKTLIGFAGQRVIRDTIKQELPEGFQTAEFALSHGLIDAIVAREDMRKALKTILRLHCGHPDAVPEEELMVAKTREPLSEKSVRKLEQHAKRALRKTGLTDEADPGSAWERVQRARNVHRPTALSYISGLTESFFELHGDRAFADDEAIIGGIGIVDGTPVTIIAQEKGSDLNSRIRRNFGCPQPEGYRKSARLMRQAEKFGRPVVCLVDTQGAYCSTEAEERGQGNAIAENLKLMAGLKVPIISVLLGEGGSGGALALALANTVAMQENAVYSILSPEGFASILWKDGKRAPEAAEVMKMTADKVYELGFVDEVLSEGTQAAHENPQEAVEQVVAFVEEALDSLAALSPEELVAQRQERFARF